MEDLITPGPLELRTAYPEPRFLGRLVATRPLPKQSGDHVCLAASDPKNPKASNP